MITPQLATNCRIGVGSTSSIEEKLDLILQEFICEISASDDDFGTIASDGSSASRDILANDTGQDISVQTIDGQAIPVGGSITTGDGHVVSLSADGRTATITPATGTVGSVVIPYQIIDSGGLTDQADLTFEGIVPAPTTLQANDDDRGTILQSDTDTWNWVANDNDPENTQIGIASIGGKPINPSASVNCPEGTFSLAADGQTVAYTPSASAEGPISVPYTIEDANGDVASANYIACIEVPLCDVSGEVLCDADGEVLCDSICA